MSAARRVITAPLTGISLAELRRRASAERDLEATRVLRAVNGMRQPLSTMTSSKKAVPSFDELLAEVQNETSEEGGQESGHTARTDNRKRAKRFWGQRTIDKQGESRRTK